MKRYLIVLLILSVSLAIMARAPLTFEERVKAQEAIERVYYNHRIWPKDNPQPKPPFEKMVPKEVIEAKVTDYLKKCSALDQFWQRPIVASQLQAEMDRMAKGTKDPATLNELFAALNDDPYLIAECLARPVLADRLIHNWYANDERFHSDTKAKAEKALKELTPENFCSYPEGQYSKVKYRLGSKDETEQIAPEENAISLDENEFAKIVTEIPYEGKLSDIQEKNDCFVIMHTTFKSEVEIEIESIIFTKQCLDEWLKNQDIQAESPEIESTSLYLPPMPEADCTEGWDNGILDDVPDARQYHTAVWTGSEMIIWGGYRPDSKNTGGRYNPYTDTWISTSTGTNCPSGRYWHTAVWTGTKMIIWGGGVYLNTGGIYDPLSDSWTATSTGINCPSARIWHTAVWTGTEMIIWGGYYYDTSEHDFRTGGRYNPNTDTWIETSVGTNCPSPRYYHTAVWTGTKMIIWGGSYLNTGGIYDPLSDSWTATSTGTNCPSGRSLHTAVWTGARMIIWGGSFGGVCNNTGAIYDPSADSWTATSTGTNCPSMRRNHTAVWTGTKMVVWGGWDGSSFFSTGGVYDPSTDSWIATSIGANCPRERVSHTAVWTGTEMIVWGGFETNTGGKYNPTTDSWVVTNSDFPISRQNHTCVWTGGEMIVWGGYNGSSNLNTGGIYDPSSDRWTTTSTGMNCPSARRCLTAVWTGTKMIVWGGYDGSSDFNTGGSYDPLTNSWTASSTGANCPSARRLNSAVWTGTKMIVWGGCIGSTYLSTGGIYDPLSDSWIATSTGTNCPSARSLHTAVWTGARMIIWGGSFGGVCNNTGSVYDPLSDSWTATSTGTNCPSARSLHTAVWTGTKMVVWGGWDYSSFFNTGGVYNPLTDSWTAASTGANCPTARYYHTAVWTGARMIIWGGYTGSSTLNTGGVYDPSFDSWTATLTGANCPLARRYHTAVWTGNAMIVWGGTGYDILNSGGRYFYISPPGTLSNTASDIDGCVASGVHVGWNTPSTWGDGSGGTRTYDVLKDSVPIATSLSESTLSYTDTTCVTGTSYLYQVRANNGCGLSTTTAGISAADNIGASPSGFVNNTAADQHICWDNGVLVEWTAPSTWGDSGSGTRTFDILRDGSSIATSLSESTHSYTDTTGDNGVSYLYQVRANNGCGLSTTTTGVSAADNIGTSPDEVSNFNDVYSWDAVSGADGFRLYRGTKADLPNLMTSAADGCLRYEGTATSYDLSGDDPSEATGGLYWYLVTAYTGACEGTAGEGTGFTRVLSSSGVCP